MFPQPIQLHLYFNLWAIKASKAEKTNVKNAIRSLNKFYGSKLETTKRQELKNGREFVNI